MDSLKTTHFQGEREERQVRSSTKASSSIDQASQGQGKRYEIDFSSSELTGISPSYKALRAMP